MAVLVADESGDLSVDCVEAIEIEVTSEDSVSEQGEPRSLYFR